MSNYARYTKPQLIEFLERQNKELRQQRENLWEVQRELGELKTADKETLDTARGKVLDIIQPLASENSKALLYFWHRLEIEQQFGGLPKATFDLIRDVWEQSEADTAATKLETMSA